jgi:hypothetical protein
MGCEALPIEYYESVDCATHCICKDDYNGGNLFDVQKVVYFYMDALF